MCALLFDGLSPCGFNLDKKACRRIPTALKLDLMYQDNCERKKFEDLEVKMR